MCSWWLASGVQSSITEKYFASFTFSMIADFIAVARQFINSLAKLPVRCNGRKRGYQILIGSKDENVTYLFIF
jgi:hypothetical protein